MEMVWVRRDYSIKQATDDQSEVKRQWFPAWSEQRNERAIPHMRRQKWRLFSFVVLDVRRDAGVFSLCKGRRLSRVRNVDREVVTNR